MKILWVVPKWTFPINDGARIATDRLLRTVVRAGAEVDVLAICPAHEAVDGRQLRAHWKVSQVNVLRRYIPQGFVGKLGYYFLKTLTSLKLPLTFSSFASEELTRDIRKILSTTNYDVVLFDGLHTAVPFIEEMGASGRRPRFVLRAHNVEADLWYKASEQARFALKKWFLKLQAIKVEAFEQKILRMVDGVAAIAKEDLARFSALTTRTLAYVPLGMDFNAPLSHEDVDPDNFLFVGRLDWPPNRDGLQWLLDNVWKEVKLRRPKARLTIAGVGDASWLNEYKLIPGINFLGRVDEIKTVYQTAAFSIAPLFYGSGTRIKIVESFAMNRTLISTSMGVQGAEVESDMYLNAESAQQWIDVMSQVVHGPATIATLTSARDRMKEKFDESQVGQSAYDWLKTLR